MHALKRFSFAGLVLALVTLPGCQKEPEKPAAQQGQANQPGRNDNQPLLNPQMGQTAAAHVQRGKQITVNRNDLVQLAKLYAQYETLNNRAPANWQEFKSDFAREAPNLVRQVESGQIEVVYNVKPTTNTVVAYEKKPDLNGVQVVAYGDGHVQSLTPQQLQQALQNR